MLYKRKTIVQDSSNSYQDGGASISADGSTVVIPWTERTSSGGPPPVYSLEDDLVRVYSGDDWSTVAYLQSSLYNRKHAINHHEASTAVSGDGSIIVVGRGCYNYDQDDPAVIYSGLAIAHHGIDWEDQTVFRNGSYTSHSGDYTADEYGSAVAISKDGSVIVVGEPRHTGYYNEGNQFIASGRIHIYWGTDWATHTIIEDPDFNVLDPTSYYARFGQSLAISEDGSTIFVSAPSRGYGSGSGPWCVYALTGTEWVTTTRIQPASPSFLYSFGCSIDCSDDGSILFVGAKGYVQDPPNDPTNTGKTHVFNGSNWGTETVLSSSDAEEEDAFGKSVRCLGDGSLVFVGSEEKGYYLLEGEDWGTETKELVYGYGIARDTGLVAIEPDASTSIYSPGGELIVGAIIRKSPSSSVALAGILKRGQSASLLVDAVISNATIVLKSSSFNAVKKKSGASLFNVNSYLVVDPFRAKHSRDNAVHYDSDLDSVITLASALGVYTQGEDLHSVLQGIVARIEQLEG